MFIYRGENLKKDEEVALRCDAIGSELFTILMIFKSTYRPKKLKRGVRLLEYPTMLWTKGSNYVIGAASIHGFTTFHPYYI
jgi:hypothetical protein